MIPKERFHQFSRMNLPNLTLSCLSFLICILIQSVSSIPRELLVNLISDSPGPLKFGETEIGKQELYKHFFLPQPVFINQQVFNRLWVSQDGYVTFDPPSSEFIPVYPFNRLPNSFTQISEFNRTIVAGFVADVDIFLKGRIVMRVLSPDMNNLDCRSKLVIKRLNEEMNALYSSSRGKINITQVISITWNNVGYYRDKSDKLNTFELSLITDVSKRITIALFNYVAINWEQADTKLVSYGFSGEADPMPQAGIFTTTGSDPLYFELPMSGKSGVDEWITQSNTDTPGMFAVRIDGFEKYKFIMPTSDNFKSLPDIRSKLKLGPNQVVTCPSSPDNDLTEEPTISCGTKNCSINSICFIDTSCCTCKNGFHGNGIVCLPASVRSEVVTYMGELRYSRNGALQGIPTVTMTKSQLSVDRIFDPMVGDGVAVFLTPIMASLWTVVDEKDSAKNLLQLTGGMSKTKSPIQCRIGSKSSLTMTLETSTIRSDLTGKLKISVDTFGFESLPQDPNPLLANETITIELDKKGQAAIYVTAIILFKGFNYNLTCRGDMTIDLECAKQEILEKQKLFISISKRSFTRESNSLSLAYTSFITGKACSANQSLCSNTLSSCIDLNNGDYKCICKDGYQLSDSGECVDVNECESAALHDCHPNAECINQHGTYTCRCNKEFVGNGTFCQKYFTSNCYTKCHDNAECIGGQCFCRTGYIGDGVSSCFNCSVCHSDAMCFPLKSLCKCKFGYSGNGSSCERSSTSSDCIPPCSDNELCWAGRCFLNVIGPVSTTCSSCHSNAVCLPHATLKNRVACQCRPGFKGDGQSCTPDTSMLLGSQPTISEVCDPTKSATNCQICPADMNLLGSWCYDCRDPARGPKCGHNSECQKDSTKGYFVCKCLPGYQGNATVYCEPPRPKRCFSRSDCHPLATCANEFCTCPAGFVGDGKTSCYNCALCHQNAYCFPHNNTCMCKPGFTGDGLENCAKISMPSECSPKCRPDAECIDNRCVCRDGLTGDGISYCFNCSSCDPAAQCDPLMGTCKCPLGYQGNGTSCQAQTNVFRAIACSPPCGKNAECWSGRCFCKENWIGNPLTGCFDCNSCDTNADCLPEQKMCKCKTGFIGNGLNCTKLPETTEVCRVPCHKDAECCQGQCFCNHGLMGDGINYCFDCFTCDMNAECLPMQKQCRCKFGFRGDGYSCVALNWKRVENCNQCHPYAECLTQDPLRLNIKYCRCLPGFRGDGRHCSGNITIGLGLRPSNCSLRTGICACSNELTYNKGLCYDCRDPIRGTQCPANSYCHYVPEKFYSECRCFPGFVRQGSQCIIPGKGSCFGQQDCHAAAKCLDMSCHCQPGLQGDGVKSCFNCSQCHRLAICSPQENMCTCPPGFKGDGKKMCKKAYLEGGCHMDCHKDALCLGGHCFCRSGLIGDGVSYCFDCSTCNKNAVCYPLLQKCICRHGYYGNGSTCKEFTSEYGVCDPTCHSKAKCYGDQCYCNEGYIGDGAKSCFDCLTCDSKAECVPLEEKCRCLPGYKGNGTYCYPTDAFENECSKGCHPYAKCIYNRCVCPDNHVGDGINTCFNCGSCHKDAVCLVDAGMCKCKPGYRGDGHYCESQQCHRKCHKDALCIHEICRCKPGLLGDGIHYCFNCSTCHEFAQCLPLKESCQCTEGYEGDGRLCEATEKCLETCHHRGHCVNARCECLPEYEGDGVHECFGCSLCHQNALCHKNESRCECQPGYEGDGFYCKEIRHSCSDGCHHDAFCYNGLCKCKYGYEGDGYKHCFNCMSCHPDAKCLPFEEKCVCHAGYVGDGLHCTKDCDPHCHPNGVCVDRSCQCRPGFTGDGVHNCFNCSICDKNATCLPDLHRCECNKGFEGDGFFCKRKCNQKCHENAICTKDNRCQCKPGFSGDGVNMCFSCKVCHPMAKCLPDEQKCVCNDGYVGDGLICVKDMEKSCKPPCLKEAVCHMGACLCLSGLEGDGVNYCYDCSKCSSKARCLPHKQSCQCYDGYEGDGQTCKPIMDCKPDCHPRAMCNNSRCNCPAGEVGDGVTHCFDCRTCSQNAKCIPSEMRCVCNEGFNGNGTHCQEVTKKEECSPPCLPEAICQNGICHCLFNLTGDGITSCFDCCACDSNANCLPREKRCQCRMGYEGNGTICTRIREPTPPPGCNPPCHSRAFCNNESKCQCQPGEVGNGLTYCFDCNTCSPNAKCVPEDMRCVCNEDWEGNGTYCSKTSECSKGCHPKAECVGDRCQCLPFYSGDGILSCKFNCYKCDPNAYCDPIQGNCTCKPGYTGNGTVCYKVEVCNPRCHENGFCQDAKCHCKYGFEGNGLNYCFNCSVCDPQAICAPKENRCYCPPPLSGNGTFCFMSRKPVTCDPMCHINASCIDLTCKCQPGLIGDGIRYCHNCSDTIIDPIKNCRQGCSDCHQYAMCKNDRCQCFPPLQGDGISFCFDCAKCSLNALCKPKENKCECLEGFTGDGFRCEPVTETCSPECHSRAVCKKGKCICRENLQGDGISTCFNCSVCHPKALCHYWENKCVCQSGMEGDGITQCIPKKICSECDENAKCDHGVCKCNPGYIGDGKICSLPCSNCHQMAECVNGICRCKPGLSGNGVDMCMNCSVCDPNADCRPDLGSCQCRPGFTGDGRSCQRVCPNCHSDASCVDGRCVCRGDLQGDGINTCMDCSRCHANAVCRPDLGACVCSSGYSGNGEVCQKLCPTCHPEATCVDGRCVCRGGLQGDGIRACTDCSMCDSNARCSLESGRCICNPGFSGNGRYCTPVCNPECHENAICNNGLCQCRSPLIGDGVNSCMDCGLCSANSECLPKIGRCICKKGYEGDGIKCNLIFHCGMCSFNSECVVGEKRCRCKLGFTGDGFNCEPIKECKLCHSRASCNREGKCVCNPGLSGNGYTCFNCSLCDPKAICLPTKAECLCPDEYIGNGYQCNPKPKCPKCHPKAKCSDSKCVCEIPYRGDGVNYCFDCWKCSPDAQCSPQQETCQCRTGFIGNGYNCTRIGCPKCHQNAICLNGKCQCIPPAVGDGVSNCFDCGRCDRNAQCDRFRESCFCNSGYQGDGFTCSPLVVNNCNRCHKNAECVNNECRCRYPFVGDGYQVCFNCGNCDPNADCDSLSGSCQCRPGYTGDGTICRPFVQQCPPCHKSATCINGQCVCQNGMRGDGVSWCFDCSMCDANSDCLPKSETCKCRVGFTGTGFECKAISTCRSKCHRNAHCDVDGICRCHEPAEGDGITYCFDCHTCHSNAVCLPRQEKCQCKEGFVGDGLICTSQPLTCPTPCRNNERCLNGKCVCLPGFKLIGEICWPIRRCSSTSECTDPYELCISIDSIYQCICREGYVRSSNDFSCARNTIPGRGAVVPVCSQTCHAQAVCNISGLCSCRPGFHGDGVNSCTDCALCSPNANCLVNRGCVCRPGFSGDGFSCYAGGGSLECDLDSDCSLPNSICKDVGKEKQCVCHPGFDLRGNICVSRPCYPSCGRDSTCFGGLCVCRPGNTSTATGCRPSDVCANAESSCSKPNQFCILKDNGRFECACLSGYVDSMGLCIRIENMEIWQSIKTKNLNCGGFCDNNARCLGSQCECNPGYYGDGYTCYPENKCTPAQGCKDPNSRCIQSIADKSFRCECNPDCARINGYPNELCQKTGCTRCHTNATCVSNACQCPSPLVGNGYIICRPPDLCSKDQPNTCPQPNTECRLTHKFNLECQCKEGYTVNSPSDPTCVKKECSPNCHIHGQCYLGNCRCQDGFIGDGLHRCDPATICEDNKDCGRANYFCSKLPWNQGFCLCKPGYTVALHNSSCVKKNENIQIIVKPSTRQLLEDKPVFLSCRDANGQVHPDNLIWFRIDKKPLSSSVILANDVKVNARIMVIPFAREMDSGAYSCCVKSQTQCGTVSVRVDKNTCKVPCQLNSYCNAAQGICQCKTGFTMDYKTGLCQPTTCGFFPQMCRASSEQCANNQCVCKSGYVRMVNDLYYQEPICVPEYSCSTIYDCSRNALCINDNSGRNGVCQCKPGFKGDGRTCKAAESGCEQLKNCGRNARCILIKPPSYHECHCEAGYVGNPEKMCEKLVNCSQTSQPCGPYSKCEEKFLDDVRTGHRISQGFCICLPGYVLLEKTCVDKRNLQVNLLVTQGSTILSVGVVTTKSIATRSLASPPSAEKLKNLNPEVWTEDKESIIIAIATDCYSRRVFWSTLQNQSIYSAPFDNPTMRSVIATPVLGVEGISVDWVAQNLYWISAVKHRIYVARTDGTNVKTIVENIEQPRGLVVYPEYGKIFWTNWDRSNPRIEMANMDGSNRKPIVNNLPGLPNSIEIDLLKRRLCWIEANSQSNFYSTSTGTRLRCVNLSTLQALKPWEKMQGDSYMISTIYSSNRGHPFGLTAHFNRFYWTSWESPPRIYTLESDSVDTITPPIGAKNKLYGAAILLKSCPIEDDVCSRWTQNYGGCKYLCLKTSSNSKKCVCPDNQTNCSP